MGIDVAFDSFINPDFRAAAGDDIQSRKILRNSVRVMVGQKRHPCRQDDAFRLAGEPRKEYLRDRHDEARETVFAAYEGIEAESLARKQIFHDVRVPLILRPIDPRRRVSPVVTQAT